MFGSDALRLLSSAILVATCANASAQAVGQAEKLNMELVGHHDLQGRSAYQPLVHKQGERWIAYVVSGVPGWRTSRMTQIYDLGNPAKPVFIRNFGLPGQQPGATGPVPTELHGPISTGPRGKRVYFGYGTSSNGILQIVDRDKLLKGPKEPTPENLLYPQVGRLDLGPDAGAHTAFPVLGMDVAESAKDKAGRARDFVVVTSESLADECREPRQMMRMVDVSTEAKPFPVANWTVDEASGNFCSRGGRFGTHSSNESFSPIYYKRIMFFAHFNAGVRAVDIRNPFQPKEIGYYIPAATDKTDKRCAKTDAGVERCNGVIQTNNVEVDDRGYTDHFKRLNQWLEKAKIPTRYQFNMISPKSYNVFFQKLRAGGVVGFRSDLDVAMTKAAKAGS